MDLSIKDYFENLISRIEEFRVELRNNTDAIRSNNAKLDDMDVTTLQQERAPSSAPLGEGGLDPAASFATTTPPDAPVVSHSHLAAVALASSSTTDAILSGRDHKFVGTATHAKTITTPTVLPDTHSSATRMHKAMEAICDGSPAYAAMAPVTCSTDGLNQVVTTVIVSEVLHIVDASDFAAPTLVMCLTNRSMNLLRYVPHPVATPPWLVLRLKQWPSFGRDQADGNTTRPMPWPSLACSHIRHREHTGRLSQVTHEVNYLSGDMNALTTSSSQQIMQLTGNVDWSAAEWMMSVSAELHDYDIPGADCELQPKPRPLFKRTSEETIGTRLKSFAAAIHVSGTVFSGHESMRKPMLSLRHVVRIVAESKGLLLPPLRNKIKQQPWPPPIQVHIADEDIDLFSFIACGSFTNNWWPPDLHEWMFHTQLGTLFDSNGNLQPWPSWNDDVVHDWEFTSFASTRVHVWLDSRINVTNCGETEAVPGELLNHSLLWRNTDDHQYGINFFHLVQVHCKVITDSERSSISQWSKFVDWGILEFNHAILHTPRTHIIYSIFQWEFGTCTRMGMATKCSGSYSVQQAVTALKLQPTKLSYFSLPPTKPPDNHDKCVLSFVELQHRILVTMYFMDKMASTEAWEKCSCQHLKSTKACNIVLDKGCLQYHMAYGEFDSKMLQPSDIQRVQQTYYLERPPDPASTWECMNGLSFHWGQIFLVILDFSLRFNYKELQPYSCYVLQSQEVILSMQSSYEFHAQVPQATGTLMFSVSTELQIYDGTKLRPRPWPLVDINQETIQRKLQCTSVSEGANSNEECRPKCDSHIEFVKSFKGKTQILEKKGYTQLISHSITWPCPESYALSKRSKSQCINHGVYRTPDLEQGFSLMTDFPTRCPMKQHKYTKECADGVIKSLGLIHKAKDTCIGDPDADEENHVLKGAQDPQIGSPHNECSVADKKWSIITFAVGDHVFLKLQPHLQTSVAMLAIGDISLHRLPGLQSTRVSSTCYNKGHFQEGRGVITVAAVFAQGSIDHEYYLGFDHDCVDKGYFLDCNGIRAVLGRVGLGSSRMSRREGCQEPLLTGLWACPWTGTWVWPIGNN